MSEVLSAPKRPTKPTLSSFIDFFWQNDNLPAALKQDIQDMIAFLDGKTIRVGSLCSGTEIHSKMLSRFLSILGDKCGSKIKLELVFACEIASRLQICKFPRNSSNS